jgi:hypothetical protein
LCQAVGIEKRRGNKRRKIVTGHTVYWSLPEEAKEYFAETK